MNPNKISLIFLGTAQVAVPLLKALHADERFEVGLVVTQQDRPAGRKMEPQSSPVKKAAEELGLTVFQPESINTPVSIEKLKELSPQMMVVFAYGQILSTKVLEIPSKGCINIHASLLPKHRGASPIQSALLENDSETGISIMQMEEKMDTGPVYAQFIVPIAPDENAITLHNKLAGLSGEKAPDVLVKIASGEAKPEPQNDSEATYCQKITKADGQINWNEQAVAVATKIRAYAGWPGSTTSVNGQRLKIHTARVFEIDHAEDPGKVILAPERLLIACQKNTIEPLIVQLEGKKAITLDEFIRGNPNFINSKCI